MRLISRAVCGAGLVALLVFPVVPVAAPHRAVAPRFRPQLAGHIGFLRDNVAYIVAAKGGPETRLPLARGAQNVSVSPRDGSAIYFTFRQDRQRATGFLSHAPYLKARQLEFSSYNAVPQNQIVWSGDGRQAYLDAPIVNATSHSLTGFLDVQTGHFQGGMYPDSVAHDGSVLAFGGANQIKVFSTHSKRSKVIFSNRRPQQLFEMIRREKLGPLLDCDNFAGRPLSTPSEYWGFGPAAVSPDGKSVYFATNAGAVLSGAGGNTTFCLVKADVATGKLSLPTRFVWENARLPYSTRVSPDGRRILLIVASHSSAMDNSSQAYSLDLRTRKMTRLLAQDKPFKRAQANLIHGDCWSPDSRFVALSIFYYDPENISEEEADNDANYALLIKDAATGRTVRVIKGAVNPSWGG